MGFFSTSSVFLSPKKIKRKRLMGVQQLASRAASIKKSTKKNDYFFLLPQTIYNHQQQFHFVEERAFQKF